VKNPLTPGLQRTGRKGIRAEAGCIRCNRCIHIKKDADELRNGETIRFMSLFNAKIKKDPTGVSADYVPGKILDVKKGPVGIGVRGC